MNRKGYKHTSLGWIPEDWEVVRLGSVLELVNGKAFKPEDWEPSGLPIIRIQNLNDRNAEFNYYNKPIEEKYLVKTGDLLFAWSGTKGVSFGARKWEVGPAVLNQHIFKVLIKGNKLISEFVFPLLKSVQGSIEEKAHGFKSSFVHVTKQDLKKTELALPSIAEQRYVATFLATLEDMIGIEQQIIEALQIRHRGLMQQLLSGKKRLKGFSKRWGFVRFNEVYSSIKQTVGTQSLIPLSVTKDGIVSQREYFKKEITSEDTSTYLRVKKGDMVMSGLNFWMGSIDTVISYEEGMVSPAYKVYEMKNPTISPDFMRYFVRSSIMQRALIASSVIGASIVRRNLDKETLEEWAFLMPALDEQKSIATAISTSDREIQLHRRRLAALQQQKKGLMQVLLTGKIRVKPKEK